MITPPIPALAPAHHPATITSIHQENERTFTYTLDTDIAASPGQFAMLWLPGLDEKPFSILSAAPLRFTIAAVGPFTRTLARLTPGDPLWWRGPYGQGFLPTGRDHILVGGGYGVAPMLFLAKQLIHAGHRVRTIIGARTASDLLLTSETRAAGADLIVTTDDGTAGLQGRVTDALAPMLEKSPPDTLYACGPHPMLEALALACASNNVQSQLSWEAYMRCGIGLCGSCEHHAHLLCADGPVLHHPPILNGKPSPPTPDWPTPHRPPTQAPPEPQP